MYDGAGVYDGAGAALPGFPVLVHYSGAVPGGDHFARIVTSPTVGDLNGDGIPEIAVGSNQALGEEGNVGAFFVLDGRGNEAPSANERPNDTSNVSG